MFVPSLVKIGPAVAEKKALKMERMDSWTDTQTVFIVWNPHYVTDHPDFRDL